MKLLQCVPFWMLIFVAWVPLLAQTKGQVAKTKQGQAKKAEAAYEIKVKINGIKDSACYLAYHMGDKQYLADTAIADKQGNMVFTGNEPLAGGIYMVVLPSKKYFEIMVAEQRFELETDTADLVGKLKFKGSRENEIFSKYLTFVQSNSGEMESLGKRLKANKSNKDSAAFLRDKYKKVEERINNYRREVSQANPGTFMATLMMALTEVKRPAPPLAKNGRPDSTFQFYDSRAHYWDNINFADERILRTPILLGKTKYYYEQLYPQDPDSINAAADVVLTKSQANKEVFRYLLWYTSNTYETSKFMGMDAVFTHVADKYYLHTPLCDWLDSATRARIQERVNVLKPLLLNKPAPRLVMQDSLGKNVDLYAIKADYTVLAFYDPNCSHCQKEIPHLNKLAQDSLKQKNVAVFAACGERNEKDWKNFLRKYNMKVYSGFDRHTTIDFRNKWDVYSFPTLYLLDSEKKIVAKRIAVEDIANVVDQLNKIKQQQAKDKGAHQKAG